MFKLAFFAARFQRAGIPPERLCDDEAALAANFLAVVAFTA